MESRLQGFASMRRTLLACCVVISGCAFGAPPGFSSGDTWTFPLVESQNEGRLLTPVYVEGRGPYLFAIDPDSRYSVVDPEVVTNGQFRAVMGPRRDDEHDTTHPTFYTQLTNLKVGDLSVSLLHVALSEAHAFDADGRRIYGILGRDIIADSLVFGFDRDKGIAWLQTQEAFHPPAGAQALSMKLAWTHVLEVPRRLLTANVDGKEVSLHVDLGEAVSQLYPRLWDDAHLDKKDWHLILVDEVGTHRDTNELGIAKDVNVAGVDRGNVAFAPYDDRRFYWGQLDGTLGLDFFRPFVVNVDWHHEVIYLTPRQNADTQRLARWNGPACADKGCVHLALTAGEPTPTLEVARDPASTGALAAIVKATGSTGTPLPTLEVYLPPGSNGYHVPLDSRYAGASVEVTDASPFGRVCTHPSGCLVIEQATPP